MLLPLFWSSNEIQWEVWPLYGKRLAWRHDFTMLCCTWPWCPWLRQLAMRGWSCFLGQWAKLKAIEHLMNYDWERKLKGCRVEIGIWVVSWSWKDSLDEAWLGVSDENGWDPGQSGKWIFGTSENSKVANLLMLDKVEVNSVCMLMFSFVDGARDMRRSHTSPSLQLGPRKRGVRWVCMGSSGYEGPGGPVLKGEAPKWQQGLWSWLPHHNEIALLLLVQSLKGVWDTSCCK